MIVEHTTFRLAAGVTESAFLEADRRVQAEFSPFCQGFLRRTTARSLEHDGSWLVEYLWGDLESADAASDPARTDDAVRSFRAYMDPDTVEVRRFQTLD